MPFPSPFVEDLVNRATEAQRYTERHSTLWKQLYEVARWSIRERRLRCDAKDLVNYWVDCTPESPSEQNYVMLEDLGTEFQPLSEELRGEVLSIENLEEYGDTFVTEEQQKDAQEQLSHLKQWFDDIHPVTSSSDLPRHLDAQCDPDPEEHLERADTRWGIDAIGFKSEPIPLEFHPWREAKKRTYKDTGYPLTH